METTLYDALNNSFIQAFEGTRDFLELGAFESAARAIGMIGATLYIFTRIWGPLASGEPINFFPLMRPFVLLVAITASNVVCDTLDFVYQDVSRISSLDQSMTASRAKLDQALLQREKNFIAFREEREETQSERYVDVFFNEDGSISGGAVFSPVSAVSGVFLANQIEDGVDALQEAFVRMMIPFFDALGLIGYFLITLLSLFLTSILRFVAPLAFAFAIFDGFTNNAAEWFAKYINALLMLLFCKAYTIFTYYMQIPFVANSLEWETGRTALYLVVVFISIVGYFFVPTMANMALSVGGVGPTASAAGQRTIAMKNLAANTVGMPAKLAMSLFKK